MADSERAAGIALERERPVGLHLNLTQPFDAPELPGPVRERQRRACAHFANLGRRRWTFSPNPRVRQLVADAIRDQLEAFAGLYGGREPTHIDSHEHVHVCPDVFLSPALPRGRRVRQTLSPVPGESGHPAVRLAQRAKHAALARRFITTERFWRAAELAPGGGAVPIAHALAEAASMPVEVMVHPSFPEELQTLRSEDWISAVASAQPYSALAR
jgi:chitin disaccharide deacetylase